jgi:predicted site-specific integrase-resolvase
VKRKLPTKAICERYNICDRTVDRWIAAGILPAPIVIRRRRYFDEAEVEQRERERMSQRSTAA